MSRLIILFILLVFSEKVANACCAEDNRTITELLYSAYNGTVFSCKVLTSYTDKDGNYISTAHVIEVYLGKVDTTDIIISSGNSNSSTLGWSLKAGGTYLFFAGGKGNYFGCCSICDRWTRQIPDNPDSSDEVHIIRQFADIFAKKRSGVFVFTIRNGDTLAEGHYKKGIACGDWKHFYSAGKMKSIINLEKKSYVEYFQNGVINIKQTFQKNVTVTEKYSERYGLITYKGIDSVTSANQVIKISFDYYDNGVLKEMHRLYNRKATGESINYFEEYHPNGTLHIRGQTTGPKRIELWTWYAPNGSLYAEYDYMDGSGNQ